MLYFAQRRHPISELVGTLRALQELLPRVCPRVASQLHDQPPWFQALADHNAFDVMERKLQIHVAQSLRLFYEYPAYATFIHVHSDTDVFITPHFSEDDPERPIITKSAYPPWMAIGYQPDSDMFLMVQLDSPTPDIEWRYFSPSPDDYTYIDKFEEWLMKGAERLLRNPDACLECSNTRLSHGT